MGTAARKAALPSREAQAAQAALERELSELQAQIAITQPKFASLHGAPRDLDHVLHPDNSLISLLGAADSEDELGKPTTAPPAHLIAFKSAPTTPHSLIELIEHPH